METILSLNEKQTIISPHHPFVVIGERINPTRRKKLASSMAEDDFSLVQEEARSQMKAGAQVLDVNAGIPSADEPALLRAAVQAVMEVADIPLCFDSANPQALAAALEIYPGKALINSTTAEEKMLDNVAYLALAISRGLTTAITDPTVPEIQTTLLACDLLMGHDQFSMHWIKAFRAREKAKAAVAA